MAKKLFYKIGEACKILEIQPYVLRYWEKEFPFLSPDKSKSGQRVYSEREIDVIGRIKELLYEEGYTIAGAKKKLEAELTAEPGEAPEKKPSKPAKRSAKKPAAASKPAAKAAAKSARAAVDTGAAEEIQKLRSGVEEALVKARQILDRLASSA